MNNMEFQDKHLRVQRKSQEQKNDAATTINTIESAVKENERWSIPLFAINPGKTVQFMNMMDP